MSPNPYVYKGYLIVKNDLNGLWWIEKGGAFICYAKDRTSAMHTIDQDLIGDEPTQTIGGR